MELGSRITGLRKQAGLSQEALAGTLGVSRQALGKWETGASLPTIENLSQLAAIFGVTIDELITGRKPEETQKEGGEEPAISAEALDGLIGRINEAGAARRTPIWMIAALSLFAAALVALSIVTGLRLSAISQEQAALSQRIDGQNTYAASLYQQMIDRLEQEPVEETEFYFEYEALYASVKDQTLTLRLTATPKSFSTDETVEFLLSPLVHSPDTLDEAINIPAVLTDGQYTAVCEIPAVEELVFYIRRTPAEGDTKQEKLGEGYELASSFIPRIEADAYTAGFSIWGGKTIKLSGQPSANIYPASNPAAPMPETLYCKLTYGGRFIAETTLDLSDMYMCSDLGTGVYEQVIPTEGVTYYIYFDGLEDMELEYIDGGELLYSFEMTCGDGSTFEDSISWKT